MGATGTASINFGALTAAQAGAKAGPATRATITVASAAIVTASLVEAWVRSEPAGTTDHSHGEHIALMEDLDVNACNIVNTTGFDIVVRHRRGGVYGLVSIDWAWV